MAPCAYILDASISDFNELKDKYNADSMETFGEIDENRLMSSFGLIQVCKGPKNGPLNQYSTHF